MSNTKWQLWKFKSVNFVEIDIYYYYHNVSNSCQDREALEIVAVLPNNVIFFVVNAAAAAYHPVLYVKTIHCSFCESLNQ